MNQRRVGKSSMIFLLLFVAILLTTASLQAALFEQSDISVSKKGRMLLERKQDDDSIAHNDRILLKNGSDTLEVFASEGRAIEQVLEEDLDGDGERELLVQMDIGGSGGFKEFALLQVRDGKYLPIWEETGFCTGNGSIVDADEEGKLNVCIEYTDTDVKPPKESIAVFALEKGKFIRIN